MFTYLFRGLVIDRPNQVGATGRDLHPDGKRLSVHGRRHRLGRRILSWRLSSSLTADFCVEAFEEAIARYGRPEIFNTDRGSQFTAMDFVSVLRHHEIRFNIDGRGAWRDNDLVKRLWRAIK